MKKLLGTIALLKGVFSAKKTDHTTTSWTEDISDMGKMAKAAFSGNFRFKKRNILIALASVFYVLSPLDIIPEAVFGPFGLADDTAILVFAYKRITSELERFRNESKIEEAEVIS
ncbi:YkvA family protein [Bacteroidia bacterium]|nr:YkvA family protein [Bacteroidia bacterium]